VTDSAHCFDSNQMRRQMYVRFKNSLWTKMTQLKLLAAALIATAMLAAPAMARESYVTSRHLAGNANASNTPARAILAGAMVFAVTTLTAASVVLPVTDTGAAMCGATGHLLWTHGSDALNWNSLKSGPTATRTAGTKSSAKHNSHQPIIIGRNAPKFLNRSQQILGFQAPKGGPNFDAGRCLLADAAAFSRFL
jgi:hypothetical protein